MAALTVGVIFLKTAADWGGLMPDSFWLVSNNYFVAKELRLKKSTILFALGVWMLAGCTSKTQVEQALKSNPEILFNVIKENPKKFLDVVNEAVRTAQEGAR